MLYVMEENKYGHTIGIFTSMEKLAAAIAELPPGKRMIDIVEFPADEMNPGRPLDLDELPEVPGAWWLEDD